MNKSSTPVPPGGQPAINRDLVSLMRLQALTLLSRTVNVNQQILRLRKSIPLDLLRSFDHVADYGRTAVAMISQSGACGSCHLKLPSGVVSSMHLRDLCERLHQCPNCGCFLYSSPMLSLLTPTLKHPRGKRFPARHSILAVRAIAR